MAIRKNEVWVEGPYLTNNHERRKQMALEWRARGIKRKKVPLAARIAQMRHARGHEIFAYVKKRVMRKLGLNKPLDKWTTADFVRVGRLPPSTLNIPK